MLAVKRPVGSRLASSDSLLADSLYVDGLNDCNHIRIEESCEGFCVRINGIFVRNETGAIHFFATGRQADCSAHQLISDNQGEIASCSGYINHQHQKQACQGPTQSVLYNLTVRRSSRGFTVEVNTPDHLFADHLRHANGQVRLFTTAAKAQRAARRFVAKRRGQIGQYSGCP